MAKILVADDTKENIILLRTVLRKAGHSVLDAPDGQVAYQTARTAFPDLIFLDIQMPVMDGYEACKKIKTDPLTSDIPVIFLTANNTDNVSTCFELGGSDYINKPFNYMELLARLETQLQVRQQTIAMQDEIRLKTVEVIETQQDIIYALGAATEYRDPETGHHIERMSHYSYLLGQAYGLPEKQCQYVLMTSPMHDVGKVGIPDDILLKPGPLTAEEWVIMKTHTTIGGEILSRNSSKLLQMSKTIALTHHEKWNGSGYPNGLSGENIPIEGRITAIADMFDAITSKRPYKEADTVESALKEIENEKDKSFDPFLVDLFLNMKSEILDIRERFKEL